MDVRASDGIIAIMGDPGMRPEEWSRAEWDVPDVDAETPNSARIYDWLLGGGHNFEADRRMASQLVAAFPTLPAMVQHTRKWLARAVRTLVEEHGVDQFLDLGSGLPSMGYTHEVARAINPDVRIVYVDNNSIAVAHSQHVTDGLDGVTAIEADFTEPFEVLGHPKTLSTLDFDRPIAVIFSCALHLIPDSDDPWRVTAAYRDATAAGSFLAISHGSRAAEDTEELTRSLLKGGSHPFVTRTREQVAEMFDGYEMLPPGLVFAAQWRPDFVRHPAHERVGCHVGVGVKPAQ